MLSGAMQNGQRRKIIRYNCKNIGTSTRLRETLYGVD